MTTRIRRLFALLIAAALAVGGLSAAPAAAASTHNLVGAAQQTLFPANDCKVQGSTSTLNEGNNTNYSVARQPIGVVKAVMLFVDFSDAPAVGTTVTSYNQLSGGATFMNESSNGRLDLKITPVSQWFRMPKASTEYPFQRGISYAEHQAYINDAIRAADATVDFTQYDIVYVTANREARAISFSPTYLAWGGNGLQADGKTIKWAVTFGYDMWSWGPKVLAHETGHAMGLPDLYAFTGAGHQYVGGWDVMGLISGPAPEYLGWHKWKWGWIDDGQVACVDTSQPTDVTLQADPTSTGTRIAVVKTGTRTAYVIESKRALARDSNIVKPGALVYTIDSTLTGGNGPVKVIDSLPNSTPSRGHQLDDGAWVPGQVFTDAAADLRIEVITAGPTSDTIRISKINPDPLPPVAPTAASAVPGDASATVSWTASAAQPWTADVSKYTVTAAPGGQTCETTTGVSCTVTGLTNDTSYSFTVKATNPTGVSGPSTPTSPVTPKATVAPIEFTDVQPGSQFATEINWLASAGITTGNVVGGKTYFFPTQKISRQAVAAFLYRYAGDGWLPTPGTQTFADVTSGNQFHTAIEWMAAQGLSTGSANPAGGKPLFQANSEISRQAVAAFLYRLAGSPAPTGNSTFPDVPAGNQFRTAIRWLTESEITTGFADGTFRPGQPITRAAVAAFLFRFNDLD